MSPLPGAIRVALGVNCHAGVPEAALRRHSCWMSCLRVRRAARMARQHEEYRRLVAATTSDERLGRVCACAACEREGQHAPERAVHGPIGPDGPCDSERREARPLADRLRLPDLAHRGLRVLFLTTEDIVSGRRENDIAVASGDPERVRTRHGDPRPLVISGHRRCSWSTEGLGEGLNTLARGWW